MGCADVKENQPHEIVQCSRTFLLSPRCARPRDFCPLDFHDSFSPEALQPSNPQLASSQEHRHINRQMRNAILDLKIFRVENKRFTKSLSEFLREFIERGML